MGKEKIEALVEGGKASAAPPLGPALGPLKINIGEVVAKINEKTAAFKGMKVPVKVIVDTDTKEFEIEVGTPPVSQLIKKELNIPKGSGIPNKDKVANMAIEQVIKVAKMKMDSLSASTIKAAVKTVIGSASNMGVLVEGKIGIEITKDINEGKFDKEINAEKTEVSAEKQSQLKQQLSLIKEGFSQDLARMKAKATEEAAEKAEKKESAEAASGEAPKAEEAKPEEKK